MYQHLLYLYKKGIVTQDVALHASDNAGDLKLKMAGVTTGGVKLS